MQLTIREYAKAEGITLGAAYLRVWNGRVTSEKRDGRIFVTAESQDNQKTASQQSEAALTT